MKTIKKPFGFWTKENCKIEALKYNTRGEFSKKASGAYNSALQNAWLDEICSHMLLLQRSKGYWTKENCQKEALKYETRIMFKRKSNGAYGVARRLKFLDEICSHMKPIGSLYKRCIYAYIFEDGCVYVGLTGNLEKRHKNRLKKKGDSVSQKIFEGVKYERMQLTNYDLDLKEAKKLETMLIKFCREKEVFVCINKSNGGELGGFFKWNKENCKIEALKYNTKKEFDENSNGAYQAALRGKWLDEICTHMNPLKNNNGYWTKDNCKTEALKYNSRKEFQTTSGSAYRKSLDNEWLDEICSHMMSKENPIKYWTKENCQTEALKHNTRSDFSKKANRAYNTARENNWLDEVCLHMTLNRNPSGYWTKDNCRVEALKYETRSKFKKGSCFVYKIAIKNKWMNEICAHMN